MEESATVEPDTESVVKGHICFDVTAQSDLVDEKFLSIQKAPQCTMTSSLPIVVRKIVTLTEPPYELPETAFRYGYLTIESDHYICVRHINEDGCNTVIVVDLHHDNQMTRKPTKKAEAALMHISKNIIALKGRSQDSAVGHFIQIFDLDTKTRLLDQVFHEDVIFWKWVSEKLLAVVTPKSVWHCSLEQNVPPTKVFDRAGRLAEADVQIINYAVDVSAKWCLLAGIYSKDKKIIEGVLQLFSIDRNQQQILEGYAGCFGSLMVSNLGTSPINVFCFAEKKDGRFIAHIMHIERSKPLMESSESLSEDLSTPTSSFKVAGELMFPDNMTQDFPIYMHLSGPDGLLYMVSRGGYLILMDPMTATVILTQRISADTIFASCARFHPKLSSRGESRCGVLFVNRKGVVCGVGIREAALIPYIQNSLRHLPTCQEVSLSFARRYGYPGGEDVVMQLFNTAFAHGDWATAAKIVVTSKVQHVLRTPETLKRFQAAPSSPSLGVTPVLQYFTTLLDHGVLTNEESLELTKTVVSQNHVELVQRWLDHNKLTCTEALGDIVKPKNPTLAMKIYDKAKASSKLLQTCIEEGQYENIIPLVNQMCNSSGSSDKETAKGVPADFKSCLMLMVVSDKPASLEGAVKLAQELLSHQPVPLMDIDQILNIFINHHRYREITKILLDYLKEDRPEHGRLQTLLFELTFAHNPGIVEAIFQTESFTHYDKKRVAMLAEQAGFTFRALQLTTDPQDIKRIISTYFNTSPYAQNTTLPPEKLQHYFSSQLVTSPELALECLHAILQAGPHNLPFVVQIAVKHHAELGRTGLISMFESCGCWEGLYQFLGAIIALTQDPEVHFKYIEAAVVINNIKEVERICRESSFYDPVRVIHFLKNAKLTDPRPLIYVCDQHGFIAELTEYLYRHGFMQFIEVYILRVSPQKTPIVIGVLIDLDCPEDFLVNLLHGVRGSCPAHELINEVEKRNRLRLLVNWLDARVAEGNQDPVLHTALAKIVIDTNRDAEEFLKTNQYYDNKAIGKYCEERDPHLALAAYKRNPGTCDNEIISVTNRNGLFRLQARYLVERQSPELWCTVLDPSNECRDAVVEQVVSSALPESTLPNEICATVRAFVDANIPHALIELLEKIVLHNSPFSQNTNLQNLLIITAVKSAPSMVAEYINKFEHYDGLEVGRVLMDSGCGMYEEAFTVYDKHHEHEEAVKILLTCIGDMNRAVDYATRCSEPGVWSCIAKEKLARNDVSGAITSFLRAQDPSCYAAVIDAASKQECPELLRYLYMTKERLPVKDSIVDTELLYTLAKLGRFEEMEEYLGGSNVANIGVVADRLLEEEAYQAAAITYASLPNYPKLVFCHLKLREFEAAIDAAKKANTPRTWTEVNIACVNEGKFQFAHTAGLAILNHPDHLEELIRNYERAGYFDQLVELLESGVSVGQSPSGALLTELAISYARYRPTELSTFLRSSLIRTTSGKVNVSKLVRVCEKELLWSECVQVQLAFGEFDQAATVMINHPLAWSHTEFFVVLQQTQNTEVYYKALAFYLNVAPLQLQNLLMTLCPKLDHGRVVQLFRKAGHLKLLKTYLEYVQKTLQLDLPVVNTALYDIYVQEKNVTSLTYLIKNFRNFDQLVFAKELESHPLLELRQLAAVLYRQNQLFDKAIALSKSDNWSIDAIETAYISNSVEVAENLLGYFISERKDINCFIACIVRCYHLVRPDVVLELAWRHKCTNEIAPFVIQTLREYNTRLTALEKKVNSLVDARESTISNHISNDFHSSAYTSAPLALTSSASKMLPNISGNSSRA